MTNATQTDSDKVLELIAQSRMGISIVDLYRKLSGDSQYQGNANDPFGPEPVEDPKLDHARSLVDELKTAGKIECNAVGRWQLVPQPFGFPDPRTTPERPKPPVQVDQKPVEPPKSTPARSENQTQKGKKHPGSATNNRPTRDDFTQNDHLMAILRMEIPAPTALVAVRLATLYYGSDSYGGRGAFEAPLPTVADMCNMGRSTFSRHLATLQEAGLFVRLDNAKGGRGHRNPLVLKPSLPAWHGKDNEV